MLARENKYNFIIFSLYHMMTLETSRSLYDYVAATLHVLAQVHILSERQQNLTKSMQTLASGEEISCSSSLADATLSMFVVQVLSPLIKGNSTALYDFTTCTRSVYCSPYNCSTVHSSHSLLKQLSFSLRPAAQILLQSTCTQSLPSLRPSLQPLWLSGRPESFTWEAASPPTTPTSPLPTSCHHHHHHPPLPTFTRDLAENMKSVGKIPHSFAWFREWEIYFGLFIVYVGAYLSVGIYQDYRVIAKSSLSDLSFDILHRLHLLCNAGWSNLSASWFVNCLPCWHNTVCSGQVWQLK